jgi:hypothetical protein
MNPMVSDTPMSAAWVLAAIASAPRVGPMVRCSTTLTGTGSAPARISSASSRASLSVKSPVITVLPPPMPCPHWIDGSTCGLEITWRSSTIATRRRGSPGCWQAALPVSSAHCRPPTPRNSIATCQRVCTCGSSSARASPTTPPPSAAGPSRSLPPCSSASASSPGAGCC